MTTCFLFAHEWDEKGCLSLKLNAQGEVLDLLLHRSFTDIQAMQKEAKTIIVLPSSFFSIHRLNLPLLAKKKAEVAIPYALEERLAQAVDELNFAFDNAHDGEGQYLVVVSAKAYLKDWLRKLKNLKLQFNLITLDWFALHPNERAVFADYLLIYDQDFQGSLTFDLAERYLASINKETPFYEFSNSNPSFLQKTIKLEPKHTESYSWLAKRLQQKKCLNLCPAEFAQQQQWLKLWIKAAAFMLAILLMTFIGGNGFRLYSINKKINSLDTEIAKVYHEFFPEAKTVISPKFRIMNLFNANQKQASEHFWLLLTALAKTFNHKTMQLKQLQFHNKILRINLLTANFKRLEDLQNKLSKTVRVTQKEASTEENKIVGILELSL